MGLGAKTPGRVLLALSLLFAIFAASCGTDAQEPPDASNTTGTEAAAGTPTSDQEGTAEPIRVGASISMTGTFAESANLMAMAYELWVDQVNQRGGINGRPLELTIYDDESESETARVLAERLIREDNVDLILGPYGSGNTGVMAVVTEREQVPFLGTIASNSELWEERELNWTFQAFASSRLDHVGFFEIAEANGVDQIGVIYEEVPFSISAMEHAQEVGLELGITVDTYPYQTGQLDVSSIAQQINESGVAAVSMGGEITGGIEMTNTLIDQGVALDGYQFIQAGGEAVREGLGDASEGIFGRTPWHPDAETNGNAEFISAFEAEYGRVPDYHAATAWATGQLVETAVTQVGLDNEALRDFYDNETVKTVLGTFETDDRGRQIGYVNFVTQWQDGENVIVHGPGASAEPMWPKPAW